MEKIGSGDIDYLLGRRRCEGNVAPFYLTSFCKMVWKIIGRDNYLLKKVTMYVRFISF